MAFCHVIFSGESSKKMCIEIKGPKFVRLAVIGHVRFLVHFFRRCPRKSNVIDLYAGKRTK